MLSNHRIFIGIWIYVDRFFIGFGNDQPSAVRAMALAKFYKPNSDINEEAFIGFVSTKNKVFLKANSIYNNLGISII